MSGRDQSKLMFQFGSEIWEIQIRHLLAIRCWPHFALSYSKSIAWFQAAGYKNTSSLFILKQSNFGKESVQYFNKIPTWKFACLTELLMRYVVQMFTETPLFWCFKWMTILAFEYLNKNQKNESGQRIWKSPVFPIHSFIFSSAPEIDYQRSQIVFSSAFLPQCTMQILAAGYTSDTTLPVCVCALSPAICQRRFFTCCNTLSEMSPLIGSSTYKLCCCVMTANHTVDKLTGNKGLGEL